ncbi:hypothetical protein CPC08DRAFT_818502 [Agrocybe pediades]|nr:hypothetical protein CPC08DRAFT_818502 [Agrocybe pediades]
MSSSDTNIASIPSETRYQMCNPLDMLAIAIVLSGICYGFLAMLFFNCYLLLRRSKPPHPTSRRRSFLLIFIVSMFLLSTGAMVQEIVTLHLNFLKTFGLAPSIATRSFFADIPVTAPIIICGADGLSAWRCLILYEGVSKVRRRALNICLGFLSLASLASTICYYLAQHFNNPSLAVLSTFLTPIVNIILACLLAARIFYQQARLSKVLGSPLEPYTKVATMCIESSALIVVVGVACIATTFFDNAWMTLPYSILPHICVISPLLIEEN